MKLTGAAILVSRGMKVLRAAPAAYPYRSEAEGFGVARSEARFKQVSYPTGDLPSIRFRIPADWVEDYADPEVGLVYEQPDHGGGPWPVGGMLYAFTVGKRVDTAWTRETF